MNRSKNGFTLIELMIVVAIIGTLAALAIPAYQNYLVRAQISEGLNLSGPLKNGITAYHEQFGAFPTDNAEAGLPAPASFLGNYVAEISVNDEVISILYGNDANAQINGRSVTITAASNGGSVSWTCAGVGIATSLLPSSCR